MKKKSILDLWRKKVYWIYEEKKYIGFMLWKYTQSLHNFFFQFSYLLTMIGGIKLFIMSIYTFWKMYIGNIHLLWSYLNLSTSSRGLDMTTRGEYFQYTQFKMCILSQYIQWLNIWFSCSLKIYILNNVIFDYCMLLLYI